MTTSFRLSALLLPAIGLLSGTIGAVLVWGQSSEERLQQNERLNEFRQLTIEQQHIVRLSNADFQEQSEARRSEIAAIFETTRRNPDLRNALDRYYSWWTSLSRDDWDRFRELSEDKRLDFVTSRWATEQPPLQEITVEFPGREGARMPSLHLTFKEYADIIDEAHATAKRPESLERELDALSLGKHRALRLTLWMFDEFPLQRDSTEKREQGQKFEAALLKHVRDEAWKREFSTTLEKLRGKTFEQAWLFMTLFTIFDQATVTLGNDLREEFPVTPRQIIDAFASLQDKVLQHSLMIMPPDEARTRLELLAQTENAQTPEQKLLARYNQFAENRRRIMRTPFGFGTPGSVPPGRAPAPAPGANRRIPTDGRPPAEGDSRKDAPGRTGSIN